MALIDKQTSRSEVRAGLSDRLALWLAAAGVITLRSHVGDAALEADECNYLYIAGRLIAGDRLYVDVWDHQPPGVFWMYAALCRVFGDAPATLRWTATAAAVFTVALLFDAARRTFGRRAAWIVAALFAVGHADPLMAGEGGNREVYMNTLAAGAMWLLVRRSGGDVPAAFAAGLCFGLMSLLKTVAAAPWLLVMLILVITGRTARQRLLTLAACSVGPLAIWGATFAVYAASGRLSEFIDAAFLFNLGYSSGSSLVGRFVSFFAAPQNQILVAQWPAWIGGVLGAAAIAADRSEHRRARLLWIAYAIGAYVAVCLPGRFWPHYYLLAWPPMVVLTAAFCSRAGDWISSAGRNENTVTAVLALLIFVIPAWGVIDRYAFVEPTQVATIRYGPRMEWARAQGERIRSATDPQDSVYVWGPDVGVYYYGDRKCATRFTMYTPLLPQYDGYERRREILLADLESARPVFVLLPEPEFESLAQFLMRSYYLVGEDRDPKNPEIVRAGIFQRKDRFRPDVALPWPRPTAD